MTWRVACLLCLALLPQFAMAGAGNERLGVAGTSGKQVCAALQAAGAHAGERVAVVDPTPPQRVRWATLEPDATGACATWRSAADLPGRVFVLRLAAATGDDAGFIGIVVRGARGIALEGAKAVVRIDNATALHFLGCTSSEGLHLSAWPSASISGRPFWHGYVYLGYDVEPTCSDAGTRDAASVQGPAVRAGTAR